MNLAAINLINIGLMLLAAAIAFVVPFETFLFAYAVLGPLHYLTQISWLHERQYFARGKRDWVFLAGLTVAITVLNLIAMERGAGMHWGMLGVDLMVWSLFWSLLLVVTEDKTLRTVGGVIFAVVLFFLHGKGPADSNQMLYVVGGVFLPTLIHVFVFTGAFIVYGAARNRSLTAWLSVLVFLGCGAAALLAQPGTLGYSATDYARQSYSVLQNMHSTLLQYTPLLGGTGRPLQYEEFFTDETSLRLGRLLGFAYTYHYLNWFSKTSVIRWHKVPRRRLLGVVVVWAVSVALYAWDFALGLRWLLLLSLAHVVLEFPLDWKTLLAIPRDLGVGRKTSPSV
ncbi:MAG: hypothetical protein IPK26_00535 [Planctomycetes bacterium]|nr:hypothetical protein [Planctomycetota bacterium]